MINDSSRNNSASVRKALSIMEFLSNHTHVNGVSLEEITTGLNINRSTLLRLITPLIDFELVYRDPKNGSYFIGTKTLQWSQSYVSNLNVYQIASPYLRELMELSNETSYLATYEAGHIVYIDKVESQNTIRMVAQIGIHLPSYATATGKAILAFLPENELNHICKSDLKSRTPHTITNPETLSRELEKIRLLGYSVDNEENELGVRSVAAPIFNQHSLVIAAISVAGPTYRLTLDRANEIGVIVRQTCNKISKALGFISTEPANH